MRILGIVAGVLAVGFFVANRQPVVVSLDPFSADAPALAAPPMPLWIVLVFAMLAGYAVGAFGMWLTAGGLRRKAGDRKRELSKLRREVETVAAPSPSPSKAVVPAGPR